MTAGKRTSSVTDSEKPPLAPEPNTIASAEDFRLAPPKLGMISVISLLLCSLYLTFSVSITMLIMSSSVRSSLTLGLAWWVSLLHSKSQIDSRGCWILRRNMFGFDINKRGTPHGEVKVTSDLCLVGIKDVGIVVGIVFLIVVIIFQFFKFTEDSLWLVEYNAALASICFMILLGFADDVLDVPWRV